MPPGQVHRLDERDGTHHLRKHISRCRWSVRGERIGMLTDRLMSVVRRGKKGVEDDLGIKELAGGRGGGGCQGEGIRG